MISPILLWIGLRTGFSGSVLAVNLLAPIATSATLHGSGPFAPLSGAHQSQSIVLLQAFLVLELLMAFPVSVARVLQQTAACKLQEAYKQMEILATADALTGLANRRRFDELLDQEWRRAQRDVAPVSLLMLDVDNFKAYNDRYGHPAGDACLQAIAKAIADIPQRSADLVARYGGEEFAILLPGVDSDGALTMAERVRRNVLGLAIEHQGNATGQVTISIGCASIIPREDLCPLEAVSASDAALYAAKQAGRNCAVQHDALPVAALLGGLQTAVD